MGVSFIGNPFDHEEEYGDEIYSITDEDNIFVVIIFEFNVVYKHLQTFFQTEEPEVDTDNVDIESEHTTASEQDDDGSDEDFNVGDELLFDDDHDYDSDFHYSFSDDFDDDDDEIDYVTYPCQLFFNIRLSATKREKNVIYRVIQCSYLTIMKYRINLYR